MKNYKCIINLVQDNDLTIASLIDYYISYLSIFYCKDLDTNDEELNKKINDLQNYIDRKVSE